MIKGTNYVKATFSVSPITLFYLFSFAYNCSCKVFMPKNLTVQFIYILKPIPELHLFLEVITDQ